MSGVKSAAVKAMESEHCAFCGAHPGNPCRSDAGGLASSPHAARFSAATRAEKMPWQVELARVREAGQ